MLETGKQLLCNRPVLQENRSGVLHPGTYVLVRATDQLIIKLSYHCSIRTLNAVAKGTIETRTIELCQLPKHMTMLLCQNCLALKTVHLRDRSQCILRIGVIGYDLPREIAYALVLAVWQCKLGA